MGLLIKNNEPVCVFISGIGVREIVNSMGGTGGVRDMRWSRLKVIGIWKGTGW